MSLAQFSVHIGVHPHHQQPLKTVNIHTSKSDANPLYMRVCSVKLFSEAKSREPAFYRWDGTVAPGVGGSSPLAHPRFKT